MRNVSGPLRCPACSVPLSQHWQCVVCRCFGHADVVARYGHGYTASICADCDAALARRGVRFCETCKQVRPLNDGFPKVPRRICRTCHNEKTRVLYRERNYLERKRQQQAANPDRIREIKRNYRERNRERLALVEHRRYWSDPEKSRERNRRYRERHRERHNAASRAWWNRNQKWVREYRRLYRARRKLAILRGER